MNFFEVINIVRENLWKIFLLLKIVTLTHKKCKLINNYLFTELLRDHDYCYVKFSFENKILLYITAMLVPRYMYFRVSFFDKDGNLSIEFIPFPIHSIYPMFIFINNVDFMEYLNQQLKNPNSYRIKYIRNISKSEVVNKLRKIVETYMNIFENVKVNNEEIKEFYKNLINENPVNYIKGIVTRDEVNEISIILNQNDFIKLMGKDVVTFTQIIEYSTKTQELEIDSIIVRAENIYYEIGVSYKLLTNQQYINNILKTLIRHCKTVEVLSKLTS